MDNGNTSKLTSKQVDYNQNPLGKGGFADNPQNRNNGRWNPQNSQKYLLNYFLHLNEAEFIEWGNKHPKSERTVAQVIAYEHVKKSRTTLNEYKEVTNRTEGMPTQYIEQQTEFEISASANDILKEAYGKSTTRPDTTE